MEKKKNRYRVVIILCILVLLLNGGSSVDLKGRTKESREAILADALQEGVSWDIVKERELNNYIICGVCGTNNQAAIAVFEPASKGKYRFLSAVWTSNDQVITHRAFINECWYNLIWFNGAQTTYAEVTCTTSDNEVSTVKYDTAEMDIICFESPSDAYSYRVCYFDEDGKQYLN